MGNPTRARLMELGKTQVDLLREIRKRGYPKCTEPYLSKVNNRFNSCVKRRRIKSHTSPAAYTDNTDFFSVNIIL